MSRRVYIRYCIAFWLMMIGALIAEGCIGGATACIAAAWIILPKGKERRICRKRQRR